MPHSILEAMNYGLIVITSNFGGNNELIGHNDLGYIVENLEIEQIVKSINTSVNSSNNQAMSLKGKNLVNEEYNIELTTQEYVEIISNNE